MDSLLEDAARVTGGRQQLQDPKLGCCQRCRGQVTRLRGVRVRAAYLQGRIDEPVQERLRLCLRRMLNQVASPDRAVGVAVSSSRSATGRVRRYPYAPRILAERLDPLGLVMGAVSLGFWGGVAGHRSGMTGWRLVLAVAAGLVIGALVLALDVVLQPGQAVSGAVS